MSSSTLIAATLVGTAAAVLTYREEAEHPLLTAILAGWIGGVVTVGLAAVLGEDLPLRAGELVEITTPHGAGDAWGTIAQVHPGPAYAVTIDGEPHRWYVGEEMQRLEARS